jgi:hypothetical protein
MVAIMHFLLPALRAISLSSRTSSSPSTAASTFVSGRTAVVAAPPPSAIGSHGGRVGARNMSSSSSSSSSSRDQEGTVAGRTRNLVVDPFCHRQFAEKASSRIEGGGYAGTVFEIPISEFEEIVNSRYESTLLVDGYAPFCKHLFVINDFTDARVNVLRITDDNEKHLRTRYEARTESELPVLTRHFDRDSLLGGGGGCGGMDGRDVFPVAKYLDLILYSREQIERENAAMGKEAGENTDTAPWGIVSIKAQDVDRELPMTPITIMRNALGKDQGGSGVGLSKEAYMESVAYWKDHANVL